MVTDFKTCASLTAMFFEQAAERGDRPFLWVKRDGRYVSQSWTEVASLVGRLARGLRSAGLTAGDRVMLVAENRPEWLIADLGIMAAGGITVPAYTTNTVADHQHIMGDSGARAVIVSTRQLAERVIPAAARLPHPPLVVSIEPPDLRQNNGVVLLSWDELMAQGADHAAPIAEPSRDDTACIIYTSGTGGAPKGVMLAHGAILHNCLGAHAVLA
ncbi:MAG: AMP-binding protein, partial [Alphaproteobacteria bacterium]|nr:AMP-binding protein [Alphaproteobacteria bacterium]